MKRVLLLVLLTVSLVELALEGDKVYLLFSTAALAGLARTSLTSRGAAQNVAKTVFARKEAVREDAPACFCVVPLCTSGSHFSEDHYEKTEFTRQPACTVRGGE